MAIDYRQSGIDYRDGDYSYQGVKTHAITGAITGTGTVTAAIVEEAFITAAITGSATVVTAIIEVAGLTAASTGTATVTAAIIEEAFVAGDVTGTAATVAAIVRERPITAVITSAAPAVADVTHIAIILAGDAAITGTATLNQPVLIRKVPQPELELSVTNVTGSSNAEEQQHTLKLLVGV